MPSAFNTQAGKAESNQNSLQHLHRLNESLQHPYNRLHSMDVLLTQIKVDDPDYQRNATRMTAFVAELRDQIAKVKGGGGERSHQRHREQGKLPVRDRIARLLDPGSPFLELSPLAAWDMYDNEAPGAGLVTGIGRVSGREVLIVANDATVKGGTYYQITVKKHVRAKQIALENHLPCVYLEN